MSNGPRNAVGVSWLLRGGRLANIDFDQWTGPNSAWVDVKPQYQRRIEIRTVGNVTTIYKGWAMPGAAEGDSAWFIQQILLDRTTELDVSDGIAGGTPGPDDDVFRFSWTGRAGHAYS